MEFDPSLKKKKKKPKAVSFDEAADLDDSAPKNASGTSIPKLFDLRHICHICESSLVSILSFILREYQRLTPGYLADPAVDELTDMFANLKKKKKKSTSTASLEPEEGSPAPDTGAEENVEDFDFSTKKKKKKKAAVDVSEFEQQLEEAGVVETNEDDDTFEKDGEEDAEDGEEEEASWLNSDREYTYEELLHRFFKILRTNNPELAGERGQRYKIPPPSVMREGNKKTIFANLKDISDRMHRPYEHVMQFLFAELGTSGSVDGNARLVIKGRFQQKQLENVLRRYISECTKFSR